MFYAECELVISGDKNILNLFKERAKGKNPTSDRCLIRALKDDSWKDFYEVYTDIIISNFDKYPVREENCLCFDRFIPIPKEILLVPYYKEEFDHLSLEYPFLIKKFPSLICREKWIENNWGSVIYNQCINAHKFSSRGFVHNFLRSVSSMYPELKFMIYVKTEDRERVDNFIFENGVMNKA